MKTIFRNWVPPALAGILSAYRHSNAQFIGNYATWDEALAKCNGYNADNILIKVLQATLKVKHGEALFERDSVLFYDFEYAWPVISGLMWTAARNNGKLNVLDFGGSLGSSYFQYRNLLQELPDVCWNIVEQEHYVCAGREHIQDEKLRFYSSIEDCLAENKPNVVLLSSVLQYLKSPLTIINQLSEIDAISLIIDRTPFSTNQTDKLVIQNVSPRIYEANYPMWIFSMQKIEKILLKNWRIVAKNLSPEGQAQTANNTYFSFQGMLLEARR